MYTDWLEFLHDFHLEKVRVYFNSNKSLFSVVHKGKVVAHLDEVFLIDAYFKVSKKGYEKSLTTGVKNNFASAYGKVCDFVPHSMKAVRFNRHTGEFLYVSDLEKVEKVDSLWLTTHCTYKAFSCETVNPGDLEW